MTENLSDHELDMWRERLANFDVSRILFLPEKYRGLQPGNNIKVGKGELKAHPCDFDSETDNHLNSVLCNEIKGLYQGIWKYRGIFKPDRAVMPSPQGTKISHELPIAVFSRMRDDRAVQEVGFVALPAELKGKLDTSVTG